MNIEEYLNWKVPRIYLEEECFHFDISDDEVEIECSWDYSYDGRGTERMRIGRKFLIELLNKIDIKNKGG